MVRSEGAEGIWGYLFTCTRGKFGEGRDGDIGEGGPVIGFCSGEMLCHSTPIKTLQEDCQERPMLVVDLLRTSKYLVLAKVHVGHKIKSLTLALASLKYVYLSVKFCIK